VCVVRSKLLNKLVCMSSDHTIKLLLNHYQHFLLFVYDTDKVITFRFNIKNIDCIAKTASDDVCNRMM